MFGVIKKMSLIRTRRKKSSQLIASNAIKLFELLLTHAVEGFFFDNEHFVFAASC